MIRIVKDVYYAEAGKPEAWMKFSVVPSSGTYKETDEHDDAGWLRTVNLEFRVSRRMPAMTGDVMLIVIFEDGYRCRVGTPDLPLRLKIEDDSLLKVSAEWQTAVR